ncbi:glyceraldehyde-3-phosphate dehydrogenase [Tritrichomonas foetus]|uniref:Glyceraldehyde-3-phosphate dehydrogenase n=1 Tax=Tritrichomonas foetus TaxID=1144522 RepID=A0A1J4JKR0_9EUKA|nr:glyceraldehyde-3-phosphate dehydrogenase [Tritrichomonas foetus]|eukprot:OHS98991.1 glyceraldehyde-3-phosphate dehydrogenase [Tritrichomonas foetus]
MVVRIAINGFGRIGRLVFRAVRDLYPKECQIVAVHDLCDIATNVHLLNYDSAHQRFPEQLTVTAEDTFEVGTGSDKWVVKNLTGRLGPSQLPWKELDVDVVLESTGLFRTHCVKGEDGSVTKDGYDGHLLAGAKKVVLSVPSADEIECTLVLGVNDEDLKPDTNCISNASCTTNCLAPVIKVLNDTFGIRNGYMTTVHAYTNDQVVSDIMHKDLRRARAAAMNIIPTSTGAAIALTRVVKNLTRGCMDGLALRVPAITGSLVDITVNTREKVTKDQVNQALKAASESEALRGILGYTDEPIVSSDIIGDRHSSIVDSLSTMVLDNEKGGSLVKVLSWYDNEWMYSCRCADIFHRLEQYTK